MEKRNLTFTILSAIGIILILFGHLDLDAATFGGLFPYYSYHVMIFVFIAGYFHKPEDTGHVGRFVIHKVKRLLLPYYIWNIIYGLAAQMLRARGFEFVEALNLYNIFIAPFVGGHQFGLNAAAWFVPALFLLELCDIIARWSGELIYSIFNAGHHKEKGSIYGTSLEWIYMLLYLLVGMTAVYLARRGSVYDIYKIPGRLMLMAPSLQFGRLYRTRLESYDITPSIIYFPLLFIMNLILATAHGGLAYSTVWVTGFSGTVLTPFITTLTGIALWLRIAKILCKLFENEKTNAHDITMQGDKTGIRHKPSITYRFVYAIGTHTYDIMLHHLTAFMIIKAIYRLISAHTGLCSDFDMTAYLSDVYYTYVPNGMEGYKWVYLAAGIILPFMIGCIRRQHNENTDDKAWRSGL